MLFALSELGQEWCLMTLLKQDQPRRRGSEWGQAVWMFPSFLLEL